MRTKIAGLLVLWIAVGGALAGCSQSTSGSRHTLYNSVDALAADSSSIVVGTVAEQSVADDVTVSTITVTNAPTNPRLGANLDDDRAPAAVGDTVQVRQIAPPALEVGEEYLLFLTPTMLPAEAGTQYFVTGAVAGLYVREGDDFRRVVADSGDTLPDTITTIGDVSE
ncbi:hypothetical protein [Microbacterium hibisci]|uniref:hypothetical protein n=1 Tax=Microbacterium hibisci TaxID=2036000 RepID=UPI0019417153|nr:hypothetical protein [Microbacterium hibisci]